MIAALHAPLCAALLLAQAAPPRDGDARPVVPPGVDGPRDEGAAAKEKPVQLHVAPAKRGLLDGAGGALAQAVRRLWEREEPHAARGNALAAQNDPEGALKAYDESEKALPPAPGAAGSASDAAAALAFDRSAALLKQGAEEAPRALDQANRALASGDAATRAKAAYNGALALEAAGKTDEAVTAYGRALALDPEDDDAKVNLELLLRGEERKKQQKSAGQQKDEQKQQQKGDDQKQAQQKGDEQKKNDEQQQGKDGEKKQDQQQGGDQKQAQDEKDAQKKQEEQRKEQEKKAAQQKEAQKQPDTEAQGAKEKEQAQAESQGGAKPLDRTEAQRLLDALRASEKNLQVWRFGKRTKDLKRREPEKDW